MCKYRGRTFNCFIVRLSFGFSLRMISCLANFRGLIYIGLCLVNNLNLDFESNATSQTAMTHNQTHFVILCEFQSKICKQVYSYLLCSFTERGNMNTYIKIVIASLILVSQMAFAHSGRTDKKGCHHDRKRGGYHCHQEYVNTAPEKIKMKILIIILIPLIFVSGCQCSENRASRHSEYSEQREEASEPDNPYNEGTGHDAGYKWAEQNDVDSCGGNSNSFIEGCEEYLRQRADSEAEN